MTIKHLLRLEMTFVLSGALSGGAFAWLVSLPSTFEFWFIKGSHYLIPKRNYWIGFSAFLTIGILAGYSLSVGKGWLPNPGRATIPRQILATLIFIVAFPLGHTVSSSLTELLDPMLGYFVAYLVIVVLISFALLLYTSIWKLQLSIFILLAVPLSYFFTIVVYNLLKLSFHAYDLLRLASFGSLLLAACGYWFASATERRRADG